MSGREFSTCTNHPDRVAIERCEVCHKPLCAYCLYYTEDGQRLCAQHAEQARLAGITVEEPGTYADQLIGAQGGILRKQKRETIDEHSLYVGNSTDLMGLLGLVISLTTFCCGGFFCLPVVGLALSLLALINASRAYDSRRTRRLSIFGLLVSGIWTVLAVGCSVLYFNACRQITVMGDPNWWNHLSTSIATVLPTDTSTPIVSETPTPAVTGTPTPPQGSPSGASYLHATPTPEHQFGEAAYLALHSAAEKRGQGD